jgi:hypothetical protein
MEFLLLWADNLDDAVHALRHLIPKLLGLTLALSLFVATGFALVRSPHIALGAMGLLLSASLIEAIRRRRESTPVERERRNSRF